MKNHPVWLICLCVLGAGTAAFGAADFSDFVTFGNSLTHNDLLGIAYGNPQDLYGEDPAEAVFSKGSLPGDELTSYAIGGSQSDDVETQIELYELFQQLGTQGRATLFSFEIGGNDILNNVDLLAMYAPGENSAADTIINDIINNIKEELLRLYRSHRDAQFIVWTLPDVTMTSKHWDEYSPEAAANIRAHIEQVNSRIRKLDGYPFVVILDLYALLRETAMTPPSTPDYQLVPPPAYGDYDDLFADEIHPTAVVNALVANKLITEINSKWDDDIPLYTIQELADLAHLSN